MSLKEDLAFAMELARGAGKIVSDNYGKVERLTKTHAATRDEAVTDADRESQRYIVAALRKQFPTDGLIGEESDTGTSITFECHDLLGRNWVIDPIDGTNNFIAGLGAFAVCIGLMDKGLPGMGVVYDVTRDHMYAGAQGIGATLNGEAIRVNESPLNSSSLIMMTSNLLDAFGSCPPWATKWISQTDWKVRILGTAALEAVSVASGVASAAITVNGKLWDCVAPAAIVEAAGGIVCDLTGKPIFPFDLKNYAGKKVPFLATSPAAKGVLLHDLNTRA